MYLEIIGVTKGSFQIETQRPTSATAGLGATANSGTIANFNTRTVMTKKIMGKTMLHVMKRSKGASEEKAQKEVGGVTIRSSMMLIVTKLQLNSDFT